MPRSGDDLDVAADEDDGAGFDQPPEVGALLEDAVLYVGLGLAGSPGARRAPGPPPSSRTPAARLGTGSPGLGGGNRRTAWLRLSRREEKWKTAEILILRHQLTVLQRRQPRRPNLDWADRAWIATLLAVIPKARRQGLQLLVTPDTILRWHR